MSSLRMVTVSSPAAMLERAVEGLFPIAAADDSNPFPTLHAWIVLRQGGLRDDFYRLASRKGVQGFFDPPVCLFGDLARCWGETGSATAGTTSALSEPERHALLLSIMRADATKLFQRAGGADAWLPAVDRLIGEFMSEGIGNGSLRNALAAVATDRFEQERAEAIANIHGEWIDALRSANRVDGRDARVRLARFVSDHPEELSRRLGGRRLVRIIGLADLRGGWNELLRALSLSSALDCVELIASYRLALPADIDVEYEDVACPLTFADCIFRDTAPPRHNVKLLECPDCDREAEWIAVAVRKLLDNGAIAHRISVVVRDARPGVDRLSRALATMGVPVTSRRRTVLSHTAPARAVNAILAVAAENFSRHSLVELAENPLLRTGIDAGVINRIGFSGLMSGPDSWEGAIFALLGQCERAASGAEEPARHAAPLPDTDVVRRTLAAWNPLRILMEPLTRPRTLIEWFAWLKSSLEDGDWGIRAALDEEIADADVWRTDREACELLSALIEQWRAALGQFGVDRAPMDAASFADRLAAILESDLITRPRSDFGVQLSEASAAGWRSADHVFVLGLASGEFPRQPASGGILDARDRHALHAYGLPIDPPDAWRDRECELFRVLCAGAEESLTLSWSRTDGAGRDVARSSFVDEVMDVLLRADSSGAGTGADPDESLVASGILLRTIPAWLQMTPSYPLVKTGGAIMRAAVHADRERSRSRDVGAYNGDIADPAVTAWLSSTYGDDFTWSATQLEVAANCRWQWFASRLLKLDERADGDDLLEPSVQGTVLHRALDVFFAAARARQNAPAFLLPEDSPWATALMAHSLNRVWQEMERENVWLGNVLLRKVVRAELEAQLQGYLDFEIRTNAASLKGGNSKAAKQIRMGAAEGEYTFHNVVVDAGGIRLKLRGSIDRIDFGVDDRIPESASYVAAIDYKSSAALTPAGGLSAAWDDGIVLQVPLYSAVLTELFPGRMVARMEYRTIRNPKVVHQLSFAEVKKGVLEADDEAESKMREAILAAGRIVAGIRAGKLPASPAPSSGCSPYCAGRDICRIPGGPVERR